MEQVTTEETPDKTAGEPNSDQDAVSPSHADVVPSEDAGLKLIEALTLVNALLRTSAAPPPPQFQPARKPEKSTEETNPEKDVQFGPAGPKEKLALETQDMIAMSVTRSKDLVDDISGEVTKFLPYDHEKSSQWRILGIVMDLAQLLCLTGVFAGLMASNVLKGSRVWNLGGWRLCLMMYTVPAGWILAKWVVDFLGVFVDHVVIRLLGANKMISRQQKNTTAAANNRKAHRQGRSFEAEPRLLQIDRKEIEALRDLETDKVKEHLENVARVVHGMRGTTRVFVWIGSLLAAWILLFRCKAEANRLPRHVNEEMGKVTRALVATLVGILLWGLKTLFVQLLAWSFIVKKSETEIEASCKEQVQLVDIWDVVDPDHQPKQLQDGSRSLRSESKLVRLRTWVLSTLLDSFLGEESSSGPGRKVLNQEYDVIKKVGRHWTPKYLIPKITKRELPVFVMAEKNHARSISLERMARATADYLFVKMVKMCDPSVSDAQVPKVRYIKEASMPKKLSEKLEKVIPLVPLNLDGDTRRFRRSDFRKWMIKVYRDRLVLIRAITGRDNVIGDLNRTLSCVAALVISFVWLLVTGSLTVELMISIATFLGTLKFIFDDTAKTAFEAIMFVFATRPFDVGNLCMVGENEMIVHDMNLLSTMFKQADGQMLYYPNSALIKKALVNCHLSDQNNIGSSVEFKVDASVLAYEPIRKLRDEIQEYMEKKSEIWNIEKCKMKVKKMDYLLTLNLRHKANFYNGGDKKTQRDELVEKIEKTIKKISPTT